MWSLCHHVVSFIVIQRDLIEWIVIFAIIPATLAATNLPLVLDTETSTCFLSFQSAHGQEFELSISERWEIIHPKAWVSLQRMWSNSAFYNRCSELSPEIMSGGLVAAATLAASPCVDMSRCSISSSHSRGRSVCVLFLSIWYTSSTHSISSYPLYPLVETMEQVTMVRVIRVSGECPIVPSASSDQWSHSILSQNSLGSSRINFNDSLSSSTLPRRIVPFKVLKNNWTIISGSNSSWSWPRDCKWSCSIPWSPV